MSADLADLYAYSHLREGTYKAGTKTVYYQDADTLRDAADLYALLKEEAGTGSPNLENQLIKSFLELLQSGTTLSNEQLAKLFEIKARHKTELAAFRANKDPSQDILHVPDGANARIVG